MSTIILDRRPQGKESKHLINRKKFLDRTREAIKKALKKTIGGNPGRSITDAGGGNVSIPKKGISEPTFRQSSKDGFHDYVVTGNKHYQRKDKIRKPSEQDSTRGPGSPDGEDGLDEFQFTLSRDEFLDFLFDDLRLPNLVKTALKDLTENKWCRSGFTTVGIPANLDVSKSYIQALARTIALAAGYDKEIEELEKQRWAPDIDNTLHFDLGQRIVELKKQRDSIPFIDDFDLRYKLFVEQPKPITKAVMFCLMDVSGSMGEYEKDLAKRFFMLLHMFLNRKYEKVDVVFIRHTTDAYEVDEHDFFYSLETGGTVVSSALTLTSEIIQKRYPTSDWNIYISQCSDGDNSNLDDDVCEEIIVNKLIPYIQYFAYVQVGHMRNEETNMWGVTTSFFSSLQRKYSEIAAKFPTIFHCRSISSPADIFPVFRDLFSRDINVNK